ncbi:MAG: VWA domain-containing protein [Minwuia sp.]|nr:VWA domain-containing protein [Minwuia sp.]
MVEVVGLDAADTLTGTDDADTLIGNGGNDRLDALSGADVIFGGSGNDTADGGAGDDSISGGSGNDSLDGDRNTTVTTSDVTTTTTNDPLTISLTVADESNRVFEDISGFVSREEQVSADLNIAFVIDVSGSMSGQFQGSTVGDLNGDGSSNTLLDAVIASFSSLNQSLINAGLGDANIAIIPFASSSQIVFTGRADQDSDQNGVLDVVQVLSALDDGGSTAFDAGLQQAQIFFDGTSSGENQVFFISDGLPDNNGFTDEAELLRDPAGAGAEIRAIALGSSASLNSLDLLDDGLANSSVERVLDPDALDAGLTDTNVPVSEIDRVEIFVNGVLATTIDASQLVETPFGLRFSATAAGLSPAFEDTVSARVIAVDGSTVTTTQVIEVATDNAAGNDTLDGGAGNDTLDGNGGIDTVDYSAGGNGLIDAAELDLQAIGGNAPALFDGDGFEWDFDTSLSVQDGSNDAFDGGLELFITQAGVSTGFTPDSPLRQSADGRTLAAANTTQDIGVERQVFVPSDAAFARYLETFTNQGAVAQTFSVQIVSNLGSDSATQVLVQSPAGQGFGQGDRFVISDDSQAGSGDPFVLHFFGDGTGAVQPQVGSLAADTLFYQFDLTLAPGESTSILHFTSQSQDINVMGNLLLALEGGATGQLQSMTADDVARVSNFALDLDAISGNPVVVDLEAGQALDPFGAIDVLASIENVIGTPGDDAIAGDEAQNRLEGRDGDDALFGRAEDDLLEGGSGDDLLVGDGGENVTTDTTVTTTAGDPLTISLTLPDASNDTVIPASGFVTGETVIGDSVNIAFVIDVSGSMLANFSGSSVGDQDGDGTPNTLLDAVIASFVALNQSLIDAGLDDANVAVIPFSDDASIAEVAAAGFDSDLDGVTDIEEALRALTPGNLTFFDAGLASAVEFFESAAAGANHVFFISDGDPNGGPFDDESAVLRDPAGINATIRGIGLGANAGLAQIDLLDDGLANNTAERVTDPALLDANLQDSGVAAADIARVELLVNGVVVETIDGADLTATALGLRFATDLPGLDANAADEVTARVVAVDRSIASTSQTVGLLVGDGTGDDTLLGDDGADTLSGNGGDDLLVGGAGNDVADGGDGNDEIFGGSGNDLLLGSEGADRIDGDGNLAVTSSDTVTTITTNEPLTVSMTVADRSDEATETLTGFVSRDQVVNDDLNIAFVLDRSGSMIDPFQGAAVGDVNGDGFANTILDAVIVAVGSLNDSLVDAGLGAANVSVIQFDDTAEIISTGRADADSDSDGVADVSAVLSGIQAGGATHFDAALAETINFFGTVGGGANHVFFLSDGLPNGGSFFDESEILRDPAGIDATIRAISLGSGNNLLDLDLLDDGLDNGSVELAADPQALDANLQGADVDAGEIDRVEIRVNGILQTTIPAAALVSTPFGLRFSAQVSGLDVGADDIVEARLIATDGTSVSTAQTIEVDGGAGAGNDVIGGGAGNDTLSGNGGNDLIQGNDGDDLLFGGAADDILQGNDGDDTLSGGLGDDNLDGGAGVDTADFSNAAQGMRLALGTSSAITRAPDVTGEGQDSLAGIENLIGSDFDDIVTGDLQANLILGGAGSDDILGAGGADTIFGEAGDDFVEGGDGDDQVFGGAGNDLLVGEDEIVVPGGNGSTPGDDTLDGGDGDDTLDGGAGNDHLIGGTGFDLADYVSSPDAVAADLVTGQVTGEGTDTLSGIEAVSGSALGDLLAGDGVANLLQGNDGNDTLSGGGGDDTLDGGADTDTADFSSSFIGVDVDLVAGTASGQGNDTLIGIENVVGTVDADTLTGNAAANRLEGGAAQDILAGGDGNDTLVGGDGSDLLSGGSGDDQQFGGSGDDEFAGSPGNDLIDGGVGTDILNHGLSTGAVQVDLAQGTASGQGSDTLVSIEQVFGSGFGDLLRGSAGGELLSGGDGDDTLSGGFGDDTLAGGTGTDQAVFDFALDPFGVEFISNGSGLRISPFGDGEQDSLDAAFEILEFTDITFDLTQGSGGSDGLVGSAANDLIGGLGGADTVAGRAGDDLLSGDDGDDILLGEGGDDTLIGGDGDDTLSGGDGVDLLVGGAGSDLFQIGVADGSTIIGGLESGSDLIDLRAFDIFDFDGLLAVSQDLPVLSAIGEPLGSLEVTLSPTQTLVIETFVGPGPQAGDFIFADAPDRPFEAARDLEVADGDWRYTGRTVDKALGDPTDYAAQDWSAPDITTLSGEQGFHLAIGDVTGDGNAEIVIAGPSGIRIVDGAGQTVATATVGATPRDVILEDINGDGDLEIIAGSRGTTNLQVNVVDGDGTVLQTIAGPGDGSDAGNLQMYPVAYLGDGDLAVAFRSGFDLDPRGVAVYDLNDGAEQFLFDTGPEVTSVSVGDLGNDGTLDFALNIFTPLNGATGNGADGTGTLTRDNRASTIIVAEDGSETLVADIVLASGGTTSGSVEQIIVDLDGDGVNEILLSSGHTAQHPGLTEIQVLGADGTVEHRATTIANAPATLLAHDIDGDGDLEIVVSHGSSQDLRLFDHDLNLLGTRTGITFSVAAGADIDGDGQSEIVTANGSAIRILSGSDLSDFTAPVDLGANIRRMVTTDIDGDGRADLIATTDGGTFLIQGDAPVPDSTDVIITPSIPGVIADTGESFSFSTVYSNALGDEATTGIGLRIHFDSTILTYDLASNVFARSLQPFGQVIEADTQDFDNDASTDTFVAFNWADFGGNWPGPGNLPQVLLDSTFTVTGNLADTSINYSASSVPNGFGFDATSFEVVADRWPLPDDLLVTEGALSGVVVADLSPANIDPDDPGAFTLLDDAGGRFRLNGFVLEVANGDLIDFETATAHDITIRIDSNTGASVERTATVGVEDAAFQLVTPVVGGSISGSGETVVVSAEYTTADPVDASLSGLGLRVHFDSTALSFVGFENLLQTALQPFGQVVELDTSDFDNDASTDSFIATNWADFGQNFPGVETQLLYDALFTSVNGSDATVNFSASSTAGGRIFVGESFAVVGDRWPLPDDVVVAENTADGSLVADLSDGLVLDPDDPGVFSLLDDAGGRFSLDGFELRVADGSGLDFEAAAGHELTVQISSNTGAVVARTLNVGVTDVNEAPTSVELDNATVAEDAAAATVVGQLSGEDPDGDALVFALLDDAGGRFALDGDRIVVAGDDALDFETAQSHQIRVEARDGGGLTFEDVLTVDVTDVAEATLDLDGDGNLNALSDGLIALGRMFGAPVQQLSGFAAAGSPGADPAELELRLQEAEAGFFDVDGDGVQNALSDGLIILGRLFGAPASQLASFANPDGLRTTPEDISGFLDAVDINVALADLADAAAVAAVQ